MKRHAERPWIAGAPGRPCTEMAPTACAAAGFNAKVLHVTEEWNTVIALVRAGSEHSALIAPALAARADITSHRKQPADLAPPSPNGEPATPADHGARRGAPAGSRGAQASVSSTPI